MDQEKQNLNQISANTTICDRCGYSPISISVVKMGNIPISLKSCPKCAAENNKIEAEREKERVYKFVTYEIPKIFQSATKAQLATKELEPVCYWFLSPSKNIFIHGNCGCGKSHLVAALTMDARYRNIKMYYKNVSDLMVEIRETFGGRRDDSESKIIDRFSSRESLVLDDIGAQKASDHVIETLYLIIDRRYRELLPTCFVSNLKLKEIADRYGDRIASRVGSGIVFEMTGRDRRFK